MLHQSENQCTALLNDILTTTRCQPGHTLLQSWNLPDVYCCIARNHHSEEVCPTDVPMIIVRLANECSRKLCNGLDPNPDLVLAATLEANLLKTSEILLAELEIMIEGHLASAA